MLWSEFLKLKENSMLTARVTGTVNSAGIAGSLIVYAVGRGVLH